MILVFPVSHVDLHLALPLAKWMRQLGPYPRHEALLIWSAELTPEQREPIAAEFRAMGWGSPPKAFTAQVSRQSWPEAPNEIFRQAAQLIEADAQLRKVWYFFECDNVPTRKKWLDELADEYNRDPLKPFLGYVDTTWEQDNATGELRKIGNHLVGTGIYPPNLAHYTQSHLACVNAFDLAMARDIVHLARHTDKIHNNWRSKNYRWVRKERTWVLVSDVDGLRAQQFGSAINRDIWRIWKGAAVVHGCKDSSLLEKLIVGHPKQKRLKRWQRDNYRQKKRKKMLTFVRKANRPMKRSPEWEKKQAAWVAANPDTEPVVKHHAFFRPPIIKPKIQ